MWRVSHISFVAVGSPAGLDSYRDTGEKQETRSRWLTRKTCTRENMSRSSIIHTLDSYAGSPPGNQTPSTHYRLFHPSQPRSNPLCPSNPSPSHPLTKCPAYHPAAPSAHPTAPRSLRPDSRSAGRTTRRSAPRQTSRTRCPRSHARGCPRPGWPS